MAIKVTCMHCGAKFDSPVALGDLGTFDATSFMASTVQCPMCRKMTSLDKEHMRSSYPGEGGFLGDKS